jgi:hypothetical protein
MPPVSSDSCASAQGDDPSTRRPSGATLFDHVETGDQIASEKRRNPWTSVGRPSRSRKYGFGSGVSFRARNAATRGQAPVEPLLEGNVCRKSPGLASPHVSAWRLSGRVPGDRGLALFVPHSPRSLHSGLVPLAHRPSHQAFRSMDPIETTSGVLGRSSSTACTYAQFSEVTIPSLVRQGQL